MSAGGAGMNALRAWLAGLEPRERRVLAAGAAALVILALYGLVWQPLSGGLGRLRTEVRAQTGTLQWMEGAAGEVQRLRSADRSEQGRLGGHSLLAAVDQSAQAAGLSDALKRVEPEGSDRVRVWMDDAAFDQLVGWLGTLQDKYGVQSTIISVQRQDAPGRVNVRMTLKEGG